MFNEDVLYFLRERLRSCSTDQMPEAELVTGSLRMLASPGLSTLRMPTRFYCPPGDRLQQGVRAFRIPVPRKDC